MNQISYFDCVPDEILETILSYGTINNRIRLSNVCQRFNCIISTKVWIVDQMDLYLYSSDLDLERIFNRIQPKKVSLHLKKLIDIDEFNRIVDYIYGFTYVAVDSNTSEISKKVIVSTREKSSEIILFDFSGCNEITDYYLKIIRNRTSVNLTDCTKITSSGIYHLPRCSYLNLTNCRQLEYVNCLEDFDAFDDPVKEGTINLTACINLKKDKLNLLENWKKIILDYCTQIDDSYLKNFYHCDFISLRGTNITGAYFEACSELNFRTTGNILNNKLEGDFTWVCIEDCQKLSDQYLPYLVSDYVNIKGCTSITDAGLKFLSKSTDIVLEGCTGITDVGLQYLEKCEYLNLAGCPKITTVGILSVESCMELTLSGGNAAIDYEKIRQKIPTVYII